MRITRAGVEKREPDVIERRAVLEQVLSIALGSAASCMRALLNVYSSCAFEPVWDSDASSNSCLEAPLGLSVELTRLAYVVFREIIRRLSQLIGTKCVRRFIAAL